MLPKSLITQSMQAYARSLGYALDTIDEILIPISKAEQELEEAKATANIKYERMDTHYDIQSVSSKLTDEMEAAHMKAYDEAKQRYRKAMQVTNTVFDAKPVKATPIVTV